MPRKIGSRPCPAACSRTAFVRVAACLAERRKTTKPNCCRSAGPFGRLGNEESGVGLPTYDDIVHWLLAKIGDQGRNHDRFADG